VAEECEGRRRGKEEEWYIIFCNLWRNMYMKISRLFVCNIVYGAIISVALSVEEARWQQLFICLNVTHVAMVSSIFSY
jgi:hypothetical protein